MFTVTEVGQYGLLYDFGAAVAFLIGCSLVWKWWRREEGRAMVMLDVALALVLLPGAVNQLFDVALSSPVLAWYRLLSRGLVGSVILWRLLTVVRVQRRGRRPR